MGNGLNGLGRSVQPEVTRELTPGLSEYDSAILLATEKAGEIKYGPCPRCNTIALLYGPSANIAAESLMSTGMVTAAARSMLGRHLCTLCDISQCPDARAVAIYRGYLWFLIGKSGSEDQSAINRTLWLAADKAKNESREANHRETARNALRAALAQQPPERGFQEASTALAGAEKEIAIQAVDQIIGVHGRVKNDERQRKALIGTVGMHSVLLAIESGGSKPAWFGYQRYFLTGAGMECLAKGLPLGRSQAQQELRPTAP